VEGKKIFVGETSPGHYNSARLSLIEVNTANFERYRNDLLKANTLVQAITSPDSETRYPESARQISDAREKWFIAFSSIS